ncbi:MAG: endo-1,4-beta-xylanase [Candidatus Dadabacteria bacterium]|nr:MAG: endo-1,4-beta-xylanase [Candidatus Dadabacteria bacterium]
MWRRCDNNLIPIDKRLRWCINAAHDETAQMFFKYLLGRFVGTWILLVSMWSFNWTTPEAPSEQPETWPLRELPLKVAAARAGIDIGVAARASEFVNDATYATFITSQFSMVVAENAMKFQALHPHPVTYRFDRADAFVDRARAAGLKVRGHTLIWYGGAKWVREGEWDDQPGALEQAMLDHVTTVVGHFRGRVCCWDVVNEAISGYWGLRRNVWTKHIGQDFIAKAFRAAHEADPDAKLFYNDFRVEGLRPKADRLVNLISTLQAEGVPIHGVGLQAHMHFSLPSRDELIAQLDRLAALGVEIHLTEVDLGIPKPVTNGKRIKQAIRYRRLVDACLAVPACTAIVFWGTDDSRSWIPYFYKNFAEPLPFDADLRPKLPYYAILDGLLAGRRLP